MVKQSDGGVAAKAFGRLVVIGCVALLWGCGGPPANSPVEGRVTEADASGKRTVIPDTVEKDGKDGKPDEVPYCTWLDKRRRQWGWIAIGAGALGASGAAFSASIDDADKNSTGKAALSGTFIVMGVVAAIGAYLTSDYASTAKAHKCITIEPKAAAPADATKAPEVGPPPPPPANSGGAAAPVTGAGAGTGAAGGTTPGAATNGAPPAGQEKPTGPKKGN